MIFDKYVKILFTLFESCIPEDVLRVWMRNIAASIRDDDGSSTFRDRMKDLLSYLGSEV